jgi:hypothetical protein
VLAKEKKDVQDANKALGTAKTDYQECIRRADTGFFAPTPEKQCRTVDEKIDAAERCADSRHGQVLSQSRETNEAVASRFTNHRRCAICKAWHQRPGFEERDPRAAGRLHSCASWALPDDVGVDKSVRPASEQ